jgi:ribose transport system permease protein
MSTSNTTSIDADAELPDAVGSFVPRRDLRKWTLVQLERYGLVFLVLMIGSLFALLPASAATFLTRANIQNVLGDQAVITIGALALVIPLVGGQFDISVGSVLGLSALGTASAMSRFNLPVVAAVVVGIAIGLGIGVLNGVLIAYCKLNGVIVTLAATILINGVVIWYTDGAAIVTHISPGLTEFGSGKLLWLPYPTLAFVMVCTAVWYLLEHTPYGRKLYMLGENERAARLVGIRVDLLTCWSFVISGSLAGLAGVVLCARTGGANPQDGPGYLFPCLAAAFLGTTAIRPGKFNAVGTVVGVMFVAVSVSGLSLSGVEPWVQPAFNGAALLAAIGLAALVRMRRNRSAPPGG